MKQHAQWIWIFGDYELHHLLLVDSRRMEGNLYRPSPWPLDDCAHNVRFRRKITLAEPEQLCVHIEGVGSITVNGRYYSLTEPVPLPAGEVELIVEVCNPTGLPTIFAEGKTLCSDEQWAVTHDFFHWEPVACSGLTDPEAPPSRFPFAYRPQPLRTFLLQGQTIYDAGSETFCTLTLHCRGTGRITIYYGESEAEVLSNDPNMFCVVPASDSVRLPARAFRYLRFGTENAELTDVEAKYEYLPLQPRGQFHCSDAELNRIWAISGHTLALNAREFFLDGIKRDRYVWSGDAYQSYLLNYYLFFDNALCTRTMLALRGKDPMERHINTILDYSLYWVLGLRDYLLYTGDRAFVSRIWLKVKSLLHFCMGRTNADGLMEGQPDDWVFIDWGQLDLTGANAAEQMLFTAALETAAELGQKIGNEAAEFAAHAHRIRLCIESRFWDAEKGAYIDSVESGRRWVSRQTNLFAMRFGFDGNGRRAQIITHVLNNEAIPQITTPYFKFYELEMQAELGKTEEVAAQMRAYWGGMLRLGATSFWEEYKPELDDDAHYSMYGMPFGKSLCHAWGASPIYLLGRFFLGVMPTAEGYARYTVSPSLGGLQEMDGVVPTPRGDIRVKATPDWVEVQSPFGGGTLEYAGEKHEIAAHIPLRVARKAET